MRTRGGMPRRCAPRGATITCAASRCSTIAAMHATRASGVRFALRRDPPLIEYSLSKKRLLAGFGFGAGPRGSRQTEFFVAEEGASAVAYVVLTVTAAGWTLEEAGDRDP